MKPKVSILIPVYNRENLISETLDSAINQTYKNIEIIVVDNKSTDETYEILKKYEKKYPTKVKVYQNEKNIGPVKNWKKCLDYATGKYGKILWSDDLIAPDFLEKTLLFLEEDDDVGFVFSNVKIFGNKDLDLIPNYKSGIYKTSEYIKGILFRSKNVPNVPVVVSPGCALFRLKDLRKNLLIDIPNKIGSNFSMHAIGNDLLIYLLTAKDYSKFAFINEKLSFFRAHNDSITISTQRKEKGKLPLLYTVAETFFVENYIHNRRDRKRFNALLLANLIRYKKEANILGLRKVSDFYLDEKNYIGIDHLFLIMFLINKIIKKIFKKLILLP